MSKATHRQSFKGFLQKKIKFKEKMSKFFAFCKKIIVSFKMQGFLLDISFLAPANAIQLFGAINAFL
jgi:hypothetical protein